ncbi:alpha/beta hydrolase [Sphingosinicella rhizophila]|uniref:Alpha/beta hydrolase n=1 Tax=Sphingosinicella rhizophila TaxID=3050082 RepID=A0ABU3Q7W9_9SPHN|nr:alpha/beta hydrolase [Sphingosinicella sp. GR2756]MDT9599498.1 alpha/beta hydrolase [Sphingosinicella sp. GR2756]
MNEIEFLNRSGRRLAYRHRPGGSPTLIFLPGYMSDMEGSKAVALDGWAAAEGRAMLRFDYAGCGASEGAFEAQSLADWRDDALAMIDQVAGPVVLVGSSMGGWLMLLAALARPQKVAALIGIAAAPDFTSWGFTEAQKREILEQGRIEEPSAYSDQPYVTTKCFWENGEGLKLLDGPVAIECPVRLLHGLDDKDVPWRISYRLMEQLRSADVQMLLLKDGDHRLSRDSDIARLIATVTALLEAL